MFFFFQAEDGIRDKLVTGVQTCALPILGLVALEFGFCHCSSLSLSKRFLRPWPSALPGSARTPCCKSHVLGSSTAVSLNSQTSQKGGRWRRRCARQRAASCRRSCRAAPRDRRSRRPCSPTASRLRRP